MRASWWAWASWWGSRTRAPAAPHPSPSPPSPSPLPLPTYSYSPRFDTPVSFRSFNSSRSLLEDAAEEKMQFGNGRRGVRIAGAQLINCSAADELGRKWKRTTVTDPHCVCVAFLQPAVRRNQAQILVRLPSKKAYSKPCLVGCCGRTRREA